MRGLRGAGAAPTGTGGLEELEIADWFRRPDVSDGAKIGGTETEHVHAKLNVVNAANDLIGLANQLGAGGGSRLEGESAEQLERAVESASIDVFSGKEDGLLRRLVVRAKLGVDLPADLAGALGPLPGARFALELTLTDLNEKVTVAEPDDATPFPGE